jgi:hypothetical protein
LEHPLFIKHAVIGQLHFGANTLDFATIQQSDRVVEPPILWPKGSNQDSWTVGDFASQRSKQSDGGSLNTMKSAPCRAACARAARTLSPFPAKSPTTGFSCASAIFKVSGRCLLIPYDVEWRAPDGNAASHPVMTKPANRGTSCALCHLL